MQGLARTGSSRAGSMRVMRRGPRQFPNSSSASGNSFPAPSLRLPLTCAELASATAAWEPLVGGDNGGAVEAFDVLLSVLHAAHVQLEDPALVTFVRARFEGDETAPAVPPSDPAAAAAAADGSAGASSASRSGLQSRCGLGDFVRLLEAAKAFHAARSARRTAAITATATTTASASTAAGRRPIAAGDRAELAAAFAAVGGRDDGGGFLDVGALRRAVAEFGLSVDVDKAIAGVTGNTASSGGDGVPPVAFAEFSALLAAVDAFDSLPAVGAVSATPTATTTTTAPEPTTAPTADAALRTQRRSSLASFRRVASAVFEVTGAPVAVAAAPPPPTPLTASDPTAPEQRSPVAPTPPQHQQPSQQWRPASPSAAAAAAAAVSDPFAVPPPVPRSAFFAEICRLVAVTGGDPDGFRSRAAAAFARVDVNGRSIRAPRRARRLLAAHAAAIDGLSDRLHRSRADEWKPAPSATIAAHSASTRQHQHQQKQQQRQQPLPPSAFVDNNNNNNSEGRSDDDSADDADASPPPPPTTARRATGTSARPSLLAGAPLPPQPPPQPATSATPGVRLSCGLRSGTARNATEPAPPQPQATNAFRAEAPSVRPPQRPPPPLSARRSAAAATPPLPPVPAEADLRSAAERALRSRYDDAGLARPAYDAKLFEAALAVDAAAVLDGRRGGAAGGGAGSVNRSGDTDTQSESDSDGNDGSPWRGRRGAGRSPQRRSPRRRENGGRERGRPLTNTNEDRHGNRGPAFDLQGPSAAGLAEEEAARLQLRLYGLSGTDIWRLRRRFHEHQQEQQQQALEMRVERPRTAK